jgi:hypothetical protein
MSGGLRSVSGNVGVSSASFHDLVTKSGDGCWAGRTGELSNRNSLFLHRRRQYDRRGRDFDFGRR